MTELTPFLGSLGGILVGSGMVALWLSSSAKKVQRLEDRVENLSGLEVKQIREALHEHVRSDKSQEFSAKLETVIAQNNEILRDLKKLDRETGQQGERINNNANRLDGVHNALRQHTGDREIHHGR